MYTNVDYEQKLKELKKWAINEDIPIMQDSSIEFLQKIILKNNIQKILEIGTAVGYSSLKYIEANPNVQITTIERDESRYMNALRNFKEFGVENQVELIFNDALDINLDDTYDLIVIDGAKGQNIKFFEKFEKYLTEDGIIFTDNMFFHGYVDNDSEITSRNLRQLVGKIRDYHIFLQENDKYDSEILKIGDGIAISKRK